MSFENNLKRIIGNVWFIRDRFDVILSNEGILNRARSVEEIVNTMARYDPKKKDFKEQQVLGNYMGSLQHFLTGYDLSSIHLSSKSMEVAFIMKISSPTHEEKQKGRHKTFQGLHDMVVRRGLIKHDGSIEASQRVINRRNTFVHDAILKQAIEIERELWFERKLSGLPKEVRKIAVPILRKMFKFDEELEKWKSLPDLSWYLKNKSYEDTRQLIRDFLNILDQKEDEILEPLKEMKNPIDALRGIPAFKERIRESLDLGETDFVMYCARENLKDVKTVLDELYNDTLFSM